MLKFIKHHMTSMDGIEIYPLISFAIFGLFFIVMLMYVVSMKKDQVTELKNYPLED